MTYDGKLYGLPMQAQMLVMAYRKDVFDKLGIKPADHVRTRCAPRRRRSRTPVTSSTRSPCPCWPAPTSSRRTTPRSGSLGANLTDADAMTPNLDMPGVGQGARGARIPQAVHGPAGDDVRPAGRPAADVQRLRGDVDHVLRPDERPDAGVQQPVRQGHGLRRPAVRGRRRRPLRHGLGRRLVDPDQREERQGHALRDAEPPRSARRRRRRRSPRRTRPGTAW